MILMNDCEVSFAWSFYSYNFTFPCKTVCFSVSIIKTCVHDVLSDSPLVTNTPTIWTLWHVLWCLYWLSCTVLESFLIFPLYFTVHKLCLFVSWKNFSQICAVHEAKKKTGICLQTKRNTVNLSLILQVMSDRNSKIFPFVTDITTVGFTSKYADW